MSGGGCGSRRWGGARRLTLLPTHPTLQVFDFLTDTDYPQRISVKLLQGQQGVTAKDFAAIFTHLLRTLDPSYVMVRRR